MFRNQIMCGESQHLLSTLPENSVDLVVTDPPYLISYKDSFGRKVRNDDNPDGVLPVFNEIARVLKPESYCISFYGWSAITQFANCWQEAGLRIVGHLVWPKGYARRAGHVRFAHEAAYVLAKGYPDFPEKPLNDVQRWIYSGNASHPTQKAVQVIKPLIQAFSHPGDLVLDPFSGSGTTAIAAALSGRDYLGIELEPGYCTLARNRLASVHLPKAV